MDWYVYMVRCADNSLYTGIAKNLDKRINEHNHNDALGARYTRGRRPVNLVYHEPYANRSAASRREAEIKRFSRYRKELLLASCQ